MPLSPSRRLAASALAAAAGLLAALLLLPGCGDRARAATPAAGPDPAVPVRAEPVARGPVARPVRATGAVAAKREYALAFRTGGILAEVRVEAGERVRRGQVLASLDATDVAQGARQATEAAAKARRDLERARALSAGGSLPPAALQDLETAAAVAEAQARSVEFTLRHTTLVAPEDGWVDRRLAEPGEVVGAGRPIVQLSGTGRGFVVRAAVPERDILGLVPGLPATVTLDARPDLPLQGRVAEVARQASRGTATWQVEVAFDPAPLGAPLLAGLAARVAIDREVPAQGTVPLAALRDGDGESGAVFALEGDRARRVPVRIAFLAGDRAALSGGLDGVEKVVTDGADRLADGARVRLVP
ncbi:MAG: efflux RND transporter periplasmic adaptor subunit [Deltaproteobacteria bacterium]|nr:efflux RND transporter periplasmic adaptor subunit [Deltaproteobacteria bacterium]